MWCRTQVMKLLIVNHCQVSVTFSLVGPKTHFSILNQCTFPDMKERFSNL